MNNQRRDSLTPAQRSRQEYRSRGKYSKVNPCFACEKSAGIDYYSHPLTDTGDWNDLAICLCKQCFEATQDMTDPIEFLSYKGALVGVVKD